MLNNVINLAVNHNLFEVLIKIIILIKINLLIILYNKNMLQDVWYMVQIT